MEFEEMDCEKILENLWEATCTGDIYTLRKHYEEGGEVNLRYIRFGYMHSLIAGAYRNGNFETVKFLLSMGETLEEHEKDEIDLSKIDY